jgi:ribosomal protein L3 glutamine methyltransferase
LIRDPILMNKAKKIAAGLSLFDAVDQVADALNAAQLVFGHGAEDAEEEAAWLVLSAIGEPMGHSEYDWEQIVDSDQTASVNALLENRITTRRPLAYLLGEAWFAGLPFFVDERVLVPRSFMAEWIPEQFSPWLDPDKVSSVLDLCCGSGCIGIAAAMAMDADRVVLSDLSTDALAVAAINSAKHLKNHDVVLNQGDMFSGIEGQFDLILCNPPYVSTQRMATLPEEYLREPDMALRAGERGLDFIAPMLQQVHRFLTDRGVLIVEAGSASHDVEQQWPGVPFTWLGTAHDEMVLFLITASELNQYRTQLGMQPDT